MFLDFQNNYVKLQDKRMCFKMNPKWLEWSKELQAIAQAGLTYSKDKYDIERFEMIREISLEILAEQTEMDQSIIKELFANETGYATPKVDVRAVVFKDNKILMVEEEIGQVWSLPGGWADIGLSPKEVAEKEVYEESGFKVKASKLIGVMDMKLHNHPPSAYHIYKFFIQCEIIGGEAQTGLETTAVDFFTKDALPPLSIARNTAWQIQLAFKYLESADRPTYLD